VSHRISKWRRRLGKAAAGVAQTPTAEWIISAGVRFADRIFPFTEAAALAYGDIMSAALR
jgi:predicted nucleic acid-binding protein